MSGHFKFKILVVFLSSIFAIPFFYSDLSHAATNAITRSTSTIFVYSGGQNSDLTTSYDWSFDFPKHDPSAGQLTRICFNTSTLLERYQYTRLTPSSGYVIQGVYNWIDIYGDDGISDIFYQIATTDQAIRIPVNLPIEDGSRFIGYGATFDDDDNVVFFDDLKNEPDLRDQDEVCVSSPGWLNFFTGDGIIPIDFRIDRIRLVYGGSQWDPGFGYDPIAFIFEPSNLISGIVQAYIYPKLTVEYTYEPETIGNCGYFCPAEIINVNGPITGAVGENIEFVVDAVGSLGSCEDDGPYCTFPSSEWISEYQFDFENDGVFDEISSSPNTSHVYSVPFIGNARIRVVDADGDSDEWWINVNIVSDQLPGDLDGNGCVEINDLNFLLGEIRAGITNNPAYDLNGDGVVNIADVRFMVTLFTNPRGAPC